MKFFFESMGTCESVEMQIIEDTKLNFLFKKFSEENSMRLRSNEPDQFVEM